MKIIEEQKKNEVLKILKSNVQKLTIKAVIPESTLTEKAKNEFSKSKEIKKKVIDRENLVYRTN